MGDNVYLLYIHIISIFNLGYIYYILFYFILSYSNLTS
jgi:hypothetical protein